MKILIIDDEKEVLDIFQDRLRAGGHRVLTAQDGEIGLDLAKEQRPDLIILDIVMPKMNGLDVLKKIKQDESTKNITVYILTNLPPEAGEKEAKKLGANKYLFKAEHEPLSVVELIEKISK